MSEHELPREDTNVLAHAQPTSLDASREELILLIQDAQTRLIAADSTKIVDHGAQALLTVDALIQILASDDSDIREILDDTKQDLVSSYIAYASGRGNTAFLCLRGAMEGMITALYYRQQKISLNLWSGGTIFHLTHELIDNKHEFFKYYNSLLCDEAFSRQYPNITPKAVFGEIESLYKDLSGFIHKKSSLTKKKLPTDFLDSVERVFRAILCLLEREDDLPTLCFPQPATFAQFLVDRHHAEAEEKRKRYIEDQEKKAQGRVK